MIITHRNTVYNLVPKWLRGTNGFKLLYSFAVMIDVMLDMLMAAVKIRFPNYYSDESLPILSRERGVFRGPNESAESFASRLRDWWEIGKHTGDFLTIARQMQAYALPSVYKVYIVNNQGHRWTLDVDGSWTHDWLNTPGGLTSWQWDGHTDYRSRFWVLITPAGFNVTDYDKQVLQPGENVLTEGRDVGSATPYLNFAASDLPDHRGLLSILEHFRPPHTKCDSIIFLLDETAFWANPPAGNWDQWANRSPDALYWDGTP